MRNCGPLLELEDVRRRLGLVGESFVGMRAIPVDAVIGTVDRCCDFDRCFHPLRPHLRVGVAAVERAFAEAAFPPIEVVQVAGAFFVVDGHKRVAAARARGVVMLDAQVRRLASPLPLDSSTDNAALQRLEAEDRLLRETGLRRARPDARVQCLTPAGYDELIEIVKAHGYDLMRATKRLVDEAEVAAHWHDCDFMPTLRAAEEAGTADLLAGCPPGDLYLLLHREAGVTAGLACDALQAAMTRSATDALHDRRSPRRVRPRLRRGGRA